MTTAFSCSITWCSCWPLSPSMASAEPNRMLKVSRPRGVISFFLMTLFSLTPLRYKRNTDTYP